MVDATCCPDKEHCCPSDLPVCDTDEGRCLPKQVRVLRGCIVGVLGGGVCGRATASVCQLMLNVCRMQRQHLQEKKHKHVHLQYPNTGLDLMLCCSLCFVCSPSP
jgi:hypothetical protein